MKTNHPLIAATALLLATGAGWMTTQRLRAEAPPAPIPELAQGLLPRMSEASLTEQQIAFHEARMEGDPRAATDRAALAALYLQRSREGGGFEDYRRAEEMARQSLRIRVHQNSRAARMLAASLLAQHRFEEALEVARELVRLWPDEPAHRSLLAELYMEMGDYEEAERQLGLLVRSRNQLAVLPRFARWMEMTGHREEEREFLYRAVDRALYRSDLPREQLAWFYLRVAEHELRYGRLAEAEAAIRSGLQAEPGDFRLVSTLVRLEMARGRWQEALRYGEMAGEAADLRTLASLGDAHLALGNSAEAERYYQKVEASAAENPEPFNRQWTEFRLDHDRHIPETLALLQEEIKVRKDVLGYDLLAWALYKAGDYEAAEEASRQALRLGTENPLFHFHAGLIARAVGKPEVARGHLQQALALNPEFHPRFAEEARRALAAL